MDRWSVFWLTKIRGYRLEDWGDGCVARLRHRNAPQPTSFIGQLARHWFGVGARGQDYSRFVQYREEDFA